MTPEADAEARFMRVAAEACLRDCGCRVSDQGRQFHAWAFATDNEKPVTVDQSLSGGVVIDDDIRAAVEALKAIIASETSDRHPESRATRSKRNC